MLIAGEMELMSYKVKLLVCASGAQRSPGCKEEKVLDLAVPNMVPLRRSL